VREQGLNGSSALGRRTGQEGKPGPSISGLEGDLKELIEDLIVDLGTGSEAG
jgi:hypothetical protein